MPSQPLTHELFGQLADPYTAERLFDGLHDTVYFIKNAEGQYVVVNETLVERCGMQRKDQLIGRKSDEILRPPYGEIFSEQDRLVLQTGTPLITQLELHLYATHDVGWCLTNKYPLRGKDGSNIGLVGFSRDLGKPNQASDDYRSVAKAVQLAETKRDRPINVMEMAQIAGLSRFQLDRRMRIAFGLNTGQWLLKQRIDFARQQLDGSDKPIVTIARDAGYADQSAFTRQFRRATGLSPSQYRKTTRSKAD